MSSPFFSDISDVLDRLMTFSDPIFLVGDVNIRLDRSADSAIIQFTELLAAYGLENRVSEATHDRGGILDIVAMRTDLPSSPRYPSSTLVCLITACCDCRHRLNLNIQSTRRLPAGHGVNSIPLRSKTPFHRRCSVGQKLGRHSVKMNSHACTTAS